MARVEEGLLVGREGVQVRQLLDAPSGGTIATHSPGDGAKLADVAMAGADDYEGQLADYEAQLRASGVQVGEDGAAGSAKFRSAAMRPRGDSASRPVAS